MCELTDTPINIPLFIVCCIAVLDNSLEKLMYELFVDNSKFVVYRGFYKFDKKRFNFEYLESFSHNM